MEKKEAKIDEIIQINIQLCKWINFEKKECLEFLNNEIPKIEEFIKRHSKTNEYHENIRTLINNIGMNYSIKKIYDISANMVQKLSEELFILKLDEFLFFF